MKTAVSVPDELFQRADSLAQRLGISRSELYSNALAEFLARRDPIELAASWNEVCDAIGECTDDFAQRASARILQDTEW